VGVDHGGFDVLVSREFLDGADTSPKAQVLGIIAVFKEVGDEVVDPIHAISRAWRWLWLRMYWRTQPI